MRKLSVVLCVLIASCVYGQTASFVKKVNTILMTQDEVGAIEMSSISNDEYDFTAEGMESLEETLLSEMKRISNNKFDTLQTSSVLETLADLGSETWKGSQYSDSKRWEKLNKYFRRALNACTSSFNIIKSVAFRVELIKKDGRKFYYDRKGATGELNLFKGDPPKSKQEREEMVQDPLHFFTEEEIIEECLHIIHKRRILADVKRGVYAFVGLKIEVDKKTLYKNKIPTARVVLVMGARRMAKIKIK